MRSVGQPTGEFGIGSRMLRANMTCIFFVALEFVVEHHFIKAIAERRARRDECPGASEACPSLHLRGLAPDHLSRYKRAGIRAFVSLR